MINIKKSVSVLLSGLISFSSAMMREDQARVVAPRTYRIADVHACIEKVFAEEDTIRIARDFLKKFCLTPDGQVRTDICREYKEMVNKLHGALNEEELPTKDTVYDLISAFTQYTYDGFEFYDKCTDQAFNEALAAQRAKKELDRLKAEPFASAEEFEEVEDIIKECHIAFDETFSDESKRNSLARLRKLVNEKEEAGLVVNKRYAASVERILSKNIHDIHGSDMARYIEKLLGDISVHNYQDDKGNWKKTFQKGAEFFIRNTACQI